ncbi:MAG: hypothetical protein AAGJ35_12855, partial [Myxococcota bacterium]
RKSEAQRRRKLYRLWAKLERLYHKQPENVRKKMHKYTVFQRQLAMMKLYWKRRNLSKKL